MTALATTVAVQKCPPSPPGVTWNSAPTAGVPSNGLADTAAGCARGAWRDSVVTATASRAAK